MCFHSKALSGWLRRALHLQHPSIEDFFTAIIYHVDLAHFPMETRLLGSHLVALRYQSGIDARLVRQSLFLLTKNVEDSGNPSFELAAHFFVAIESTIAAVFYDYALAAIGAAVFLLSVPETRAALQDGTFATDTLDSSQRTELFGRR